MFVFIVLSLAIAIIVWSTLRVASRADDELSNIDIVRERSIKKREKIEKKG